MNIEAALAEEAQRYALNAEGRVAALKAELADLEGRKQELVGKLKEAEAAPERLRTFQPSVGPNFQCPRCWIQNGRHSVLRGVPSSTSDDLMQCRECPAEFVIPSR
jgi:hypothetical protein